MSEIPVSGSLMFWLSGLLCFLDLREHAIFTLRNLLEGNLENQKVVNDLRPNSNEESAVDG